MCRTRRASEMTKKGRQTRQRRSREREREIDQDGVDSEKRKEERSYKRSASGDYVKRKTQRTQGCEGKESPRKREGMRGEWMRTSEEGSVV